MNNALKKLCPYTKGIQTKTGCCPSQYHPKNVKNKQQNGKKLLLLLLLQMNSEGVQTARQELGKTSLQTTCSHSPLRCGLVAFGTRPIIQYKMRPPTTVFSSTAGGLGKCVLVNKTHHWPEGVQRAHQGTEGVQKMSLKICNVKYAKRVQCVCNIFFGAPRSCYTPSQCSFFLCSIICEATRRMICMF